MSSSPFGAAVRLARDSLYIGVGAGVLAVQRLQVRRRELERQVGQLFTSTPSPSNGSTDPAA